MMNLLYAKFALEMYIRGEFVEENGDLIKFDENYGIDDFFKKLNEKLYVDEFYNTNVYYYFRCVDNDRYYPFWLPSVIDLIHEPSDDFPTGLQFFPYGEGPARLGELSESEQKLDIQTNTGLSNIHNFPNSVYIRSWIKIRENYIQFHKILSTYKYRSIPLHTASYTYSNQKRRTIKRNNETGAIISDETIDVPSLKDPSWEIAVNSNGIVYNEVIDTLDIEFDIIQDRAKHYEKSTIYYDHALIGDDGWSYIYNNQKQDILVNNKISLKTPNPRSIVSGSGVYSTIILFNNAGGSRIVSEIKEYEMNELYEVLNTPT